MKVSPGSSYGVLTLVLFLSKKIIHRSPIPPKMLGQQRILYLTCSAGVGRVHEATRETVRGTAADEQDPPAPTNPVSLAWHVRTCPVVDTGTVPDLGFFTLDERECENEICSQWAKVNVCTKISFLSIFGITDDSKLCRESLVLVCSTNLIQHVQ